MRLFKGFLLTIIGLFIMITLLSLLIPSKVMVARGVVIYGNPKKVFAEINNLRNWQHWQPVFKTDPIAMHYSPDSTGVNSFCEWKNRGKQNKLLVTAVAEDKVTVALSREGESEVVNTFSILPLPDSNSVQVEWRALTKLKWYPWEKFYGLFIEKMSGEGYEEALNSLKTYVEGH